MAINELTPELRAKFKALRACLQRFARDTQDAGRTDQAMGDYLLIGHILDHGGGWEELYGYLYSCYQGLTFLEEDAVKGEGVSNA